LNNSLFITLLNPSIALVLAAAFFLLWRYQRHRPYLAMLGLAYTGTAIGFLLQGFILPIGYGPTKLLSIVLFTLSAILLAGAVVARYTGRVPIIPLATFGAAGVAAFSYFMFVLPDLSWRILSLNFALGAISLVVASELRVIPDKGPVERILFALSLLSGLNFLARPLALMALSGGYADDSALYSSPYWTTSVYSHGLLSLMLALTLFTAEALDRVRDLKSDSVTDALSGLLNRRGFEAKAAQLLERCAKGNLPVALVVADLDQFKALNDRHGHAAGDKVIIEFASRLRMAAGVRGVAGRLGGEEFAVVLPLADPAAARLLAEAVRAVFSAEAVNGLPPDVRVTASFGVAARCGEEGLAELMCRADEALYHAKKSGRDSVRVSYERGPMAVPTPAGAA
jgi:diguanylate cyclase (GGDEF)-like protein